MSTSEEPKPNPKEFTDEQVRKFEEALFETPEIIGYSNTLIRHYFVTKNWKELQRLNILCAEKTPWKPYIHFANRLILSHIPHCSNKVIETLEKSLPEFPDKAGIYYNLGHIYSELAVPPLHETKDYSDWTRVDTEKENIKKVDNTSLKKAGEYLNKSLSLFTKRSDKFNCLKTIGTLHFCALDYPKALEYYEQAFQYVSTMNKSMMLFEIGLTYLFMNKINEAKEHFHKTIDFDKEYAFGIYKNTMLAYEWLGYIVLKGNDIELAKQYLRMSTEIKEDNYIKFSGFPLILARKLIEKGAFKEVKEYCIEVMSITSAHKDKVLELLNECDSKLDSK